MDPDVLSVPNHSNHTVPIVYEGHVPQLQSVGVEEGVDTSLTVLVSHQLGTFQALCKCRTPIPREDGDSPPEDRVDHIVREGVVIIIIAEVTWSSRPIHDATSHDVVDNVKIRAVVTLSVATDSHCRELIFQIFSFKIPGMDVYDKIAIHGDVVGGLDVHPEPHEVKEVVVLQVDVLSLEDVQTQTMPMVDGRVLHLTIPVASSLEPESRPERIILGAVVDLHIVQDRLPCPVHVVLLDEVTGDELAPPLLLVFSLHSDVPVEEEDFSSHVHAVVV
mmetsp:Transcript_29264/g.28393  ORF Transcript_29264/g.28393 Transcript_29264/m.28393 type:complete len:276 (+) Transcript_29264:1161-1988(+)